MRAKVIVGLVLAAAIAGVLIGVTRTPTSPAPRPVVSNPSPPQNPESNQLTTAPIEVATDIPAPTPEATPPAPANPAVPLKSAATPQGAIQAATLKRISELQDLSANNDATSLQIILSELNNGNREIRHAAIEAAIQFGSRDAIPSLLDAAAHTEDPSEKAELTEAADYLKLPSLTEVLARQQKGKTPAQTARHNFPSKKEAAQAPRPPP